VSPPRERNDRSRASSKPFSKPGAQRPSEPQEKSGKGGWTPDLARQPGRGGKPAHRRRGEISQDWLWGWHAVKAALANPARDGFKRLLVNPARLSDVEVDAAKVGLRPELLAPAELSRLLPPGAVHQGVALLADPLEPIDIDDLARSPSGVLVMLDQVTDPQNVGAVFRSAAAFGAKGVILQDRHAPTLSGALAKAAAGAADRTPHARVVNLSRALETLGAAGWRIVGLDGEAAETLSAVLDSRPTVLVLGSEGEGLRRLVSEHCDTLAHIAMPGGFESLNVSAAAAIALYAVNQAQSEFA
jgi:23S rRNA (guanosine2251-2'-O)-methyltransferase